MFVHHLQSLWWSCDSWVFTGLVDSKHCTWSPMVHHWWFKFMFWIQLYHGIVGIDHWWFAKDEYFWDPTYLSLSLWYRSCFEFTKKLGGRVLMIGSFGQTQSVLTSPSGPTRPFFGPSTAPCGVSTRGSPWSVPRYPEYSEEIYPDVRWPCNTKRFIGGTYHVEGLFLGPM